MEDVYQNLLETKNSGLANKPMISKKVDLDLLGAPGEITSLGRIEELLKSPLVSPYQGSIPSCVHCTIKFLNDYNSYFNDKNPVDLSWLYTYAQVKHFASGTSVDESFDKVCEKGQPQDKTFPSRLAIEKGDAWAKTVSIPQNAHDEAINWQAKDHLKISGARQALYTSLIQTPLGVGANVGSNWNANGTIYSFDQQFGHMFVIVDVLDAKNISIIREYTGFNLGDKDYGNWVSINWWKDDGKWDLRILDKNYPIFFGKILVDKTDTLFVERKEKKSMKLIKGPGQEIYLVNLNNKLLWLCNEDTYAAIVDDNKDFSQVEVVSQEVLDSYVKGPSLNIYGMNLLDIIKFWAKAKKIQVE